MSVFEAENYQDFLRQQRQQNPHKRGMVKAMADRLRCHPTFISQVLNGRADLSHDQAIRVAAFFQLSEDETAFFLDLLNRDRAGSSEAKAYFQALIDRKRAERRVFQKRARLSSTLESSQEVTYLSRWTHPLAHAALQIPSYRNPRTLSRLLGLSLAETVDVLQTLSSLKLARKEGDSWLPTKAGLHIGRDSPLAGNFHANWRMKTATELVGRKRGLRHSCFSSVFAISPEVAERVREALLKVLEQARQEMLESPPEELYSLCLDFYPLAP
jgi:uncharacterized protein (TIGR02147 family)